MRKMRLFDRYDIVLAKGEAEVARQKASPLLESHVC